MATKIMKSIAPQLREIVTLICSPTSPEDLRMAQIKTIQLCNTVLLQEAEDRWQDRVVVQRQKGREI